MQIRAGYEIAYQCPQPTPMILMLSVHPSRAGDPVTVHVKIFVPPSPAKFYRDSFGNVCHVVHAPAGFLTMSTDFLINDSGQPDAVAPHAIQHPLEQLPVDTLFYLLGSRDCEA